MHSVKWIIGGCVGGVILIIAAYLSAEPPVQQTSKLPLRQHQMLPSQRQLTGQNEIEDLSLTYWSVITSSRQFIRNAHTGSSGGITSHLKSSYELVNEVQRDDGTIIHIRLIARDDTDLPRQGGGDFWTATLTSVSGHFSTAGHIVDYDNGTYSVYFFAVWQGMSHVNITLVHPSAAVEYLREHVWTQFRLYFDGHFVRGDMKSNTLCTVVSTSEQWENKCVFSHPLALGNYVFICEIPDNLPCDSFVGYGQDHGGLAQPNQQKGWARFMEGHEHLFKNRMYRKVTNGPGTIQTHRDGPKFSSSTFTHTTTTMADFSSGYWEGTTWRSLLIDQDQFKDSHRIGECLRDKHVFLIGDSTLGQVYHLLCRKLGVSFDPYPGNNKTATTSNHIIDYNITLWRSFHHIKVGRAKSDFNIAVFEVDVLESLGKESCDSIIIFGFGVHFRQWSRSAFVDRVTHIKSAILRFRERCPKTPIIIKSPHKARNLNSGKKINEEAISYSDWFVYEILSIMKLHFQNVDVLFLNVWDMNLAFPWPDENHMPENVVKQELNMMLSMICL